MQTPKRPFSKVERDSIDCEELMQAYVEDVPGVEFRARTDDDGYIVWVFSRRGTVIGRYHPDAGVFRPAGRDSVRVARPEEAPELIAQILAKVRPG